jgi:light-regulated signal transduction histidine kinase (bacteriophytochrome)
MGCQVLARLPQHATGVTVIERQLRAAERVRRMVDDLLDPPSLNDGLGLGLHIVHHIVHAHDGTLSAESEWGETSRGPHRSRAGTFARVMGPR